MEPATGAADGETGTGETQTRDEVPVDGESPGFGEPDRLIL